MRRIHLPLFVDFDDDPAVAKLLRYTKPGEARALRDLLVGMWRYCKREMSDGHVPREIVGKLVYPDTPRIGERDAQRLVDCGIAEHTDEGYFLPGYLKHNKSRAQIEADTAKKAEAGKKGGVASGLVRKSEADTKRDASAPRSHGASTPRSHRQRQRHTTETDVELEQGGERPETSAPAAATKPSPKSPSDARCTAHIGVAEPGPCKGCGRERERAEREVERAAEKARLAAEEAARDCPDCEGTHFVLDDDKKPTRRKCTHPRSRRTA